MSSRRSRVNISDLCANSRQEFVQKSTHRSSPLAEISPIPHHIRRAANFLLQIHRSIFAHFEKKRQLGRLRSLIQGRAERSADWCARAPPGLSNLHRRNPLGALAAIIEVCELRGAPDSWGNLRMAVRLLGFFRRYLRFRQNQRNFRRNYRLRLRFHQRLPAFYATQLDRRRRRNLYGAMPCSRWKRGVWARPAFSPGPDHWSAPQRCRLIFPFALRSLEIQRFAVLATLRNR